MPLSTLLHVAIKTNNLAATVKFYRDVLGLSLVPRPDFAHKGAWLAASDAPPMIHLYQAGHGVADGLPTPDGTAAIDHVSIAATGYKAFVDRFQSAGLDWREYKVPGTGLWQLFVYDPSGVKVELTFNGVEERGAEPDLSPGRVWRADEDFFKKPMVADAC